MKGRALLAEPGDGRPSARRFAPGALVVFAVALAVRLVYLAFLHRTAFWDERGLLADGDFYLRRARGLASGDLVGEAAAFLSPAYTGFCAVLVRVGAVDAWGPGAIKVAQAVLGAWSCALLASAGRRMFSPAVGVVAGLGLALYAPHVYACGLVLPSTLVVFGNLAVLALAAGELPRPDPNGATEPSRRPGLVRALALGGAVALAALAKPNALLLAPLLGGWILLRGGTPLARRASRAGAFALALILGLAPVALANRAASGELVVISTNGGVNLWKGNGPTANGTHVQLPHAIIDLGHYLDGTLPSAEAAVAQDRELRQATREQISEHPGRALRLFGKKLALAFDARELGIRDQIDFVAERVPPLGGLLRFWMIAPLGIAGLVLGARGRRFPLVALLAAQVATLVLVFVLERFRLVLAAGLILLAAERLVAWAAVARERGWRRLRADAGLVALALAVCLIPVPNMPPVGRAEQYRHVALGHLKAGRTAEGVDGLRRALDERWSLSMPFAEAVTRFNLARALESLGRRDEARVEYERVLAELADRGGPPYPGGLTPAVVRRRIDGLAR